MGLIPDDGFWGRKEIANQFVHFTLAFMATFAVTFFTNSDGALAVGGALGLAVESMQASKLTYEEWRGRLVDSIRDLMVWIIGGIAVKGFIIMVRMMP